MEIKKSDFELGKRIGGGRFSDVYLCRTLNDTNFFFSEYALKITEPEDELPPHNVKNELKLLRKLADAQDKEDKENGTSIGRNVVRLIAFYQSPIEIGLLFPFYKTDLNGVIASNTKVRSAFNLQDGTITKKRENNFSTSQIIQIFKGLLRGLAFIHSQGIIHRDVNPNNIMFESPSELEPVIIDFGISYMEPDNNGLEKGDSKITDIATGYYKAPELLLSVKDYSNKVDIWSAGVILMLISSKEFTTPYSKDSAHSDLALLASIFNTFGSPPDNWQEVKSSRSYGAMNTAFFRKTRRSTDDLLFKLKDHPQCVETFNSMMVYESSCRLSASEALKRIDSERLQNQ
ncbi:hypothetical protein KL930_001646 [Ogataea haglerorum]|uniref:Protein kinase domain-containing protein n=1 Tax=Ogataea haglerorum TaxID=1937702 RepID=A0AAN6D8R1_9ASCO|nr:uncharacterized protein KL911_001590 [Ogataea haglerorum]KAG7697984.1 hypothetical protein KL915_001701 [Ogataea haglerorum]KAG7699721.1 hypothetical protein KL951_001438 [Ogataea haglerorum]KAG7708207.1 hypothetical protein KL914_001933 [Ogataea haglerorum]KAG7710766.1 hypothetical protein KL950_001679 [Ogataea haglerorum]KAG7721385.1 hypothetical protein KL913_001121 [Ogataea haglerorum]